MGALQEVFEASLRENLTLKKVGTKLIAQKIERLGITLSPEHLANIEASFENVDGDAEATIWFDDLQLDGLEHVELVIEADEVSEIAEDYIRRATESLPDVVADISELLLKEIKAGAHEALDEHRAERGEFEAALNKKWGQALDLLELFLGAALEAGATFNEERRPKAVEEQNYVFEVLTRLHARACQIGAEVLTLLKGGFADGAHARWRTLHEIAVTALFVKQHGNDLAERYLLHEHVENYRAARQFQEHCARLGYEPISDEEMAEIQAGYEHVVNRFGNPYRNRYGWAASALANSNPNFDHIEQAIDLTHWRPYYKLASHNVHAGPKGILFKLGLENPNILLAGASDNGLTEPAHGAAISLVQVTCALLTLNSDIDSLVKCNVLMKLEQEIGDAFWQVDEDTEQ